ncbi:enoyl-CoA hydratase [Mycolicibacterium baixiangningiae]|uniref:enoyl-CoA hydratase n=1 Tax=Mycolicibacterium baixiangningiae TaxID=2761578 RepID=UPI001867E21E|nr:enoyl-CoA hydratase [Mycolicibacterium baixiangningiae]
MRVASDDAGPDPDLEAVLYEVTPAGVAVVTLNRPERLNAWGADISAGFYSAIDRAEADPAVRAIVLTGSGRAFCAGAHLGSMATISDSLGGSGNGNAPDVSTIVGERHPHFLTALRKPIIAAINGACVGIGLTHALMCDVRFAADGAKFATSFARRGLIAEYGISWILPRLIGFGAAMDLLLSGRTFYADEAARLGLVKDVVAPELLMTRAMEYAEDLAANCSPASLAIIKEQTYGDAERDVVDASARAEKLMGESLLRPDVIEGIVSFLEKRAPSFPTLQEGP